MKIRKHGDVVYASYLISQETLNINQIKSIIGNYLHIPVKRNLHLIHLHEGSKL